MNAYHPMALAAMIAFVVTGEQHIGLGALLLACTASIIHEIRGVKP